MWSIEFIKNRMAPFNSIDRSFSPFIPKVFIRSEEENRLNMIERKLKLLAFIKFLETEFGFKFNVKSFKHRIRLQKYVFIANFLGWNNEYAFNIYVRGPYSPDLASDYYNLENREPTVEEFDRYLSSLNKDIFTEIITEKNVGWLEVGTTMLSLYVNNKNKIDKNQIRSYLIERTKDIKSDYDEDNFIEEVFNELERHQLIK
jgi:uncharacterized protein YwgA